jgi:hypothetical protein
VINTNTYLYISILLYFCYTSTVNWIVQSLALFLFTLYKLSVTAGTRITDSLYKVSLQALCLPITGPWWNTCNKIKASDWLSPAVFAGGRRAEATFFLPQRNTFAKAHEKCCRSEGVLPSILICFI